MDARAQTGCVSPRLAGTGGIPARNEEKLGNIGNPVGSCPGAGCTLLCTLPLSDARRMKELLDPVTVGLALISDESGRMGAGRSHVIILSSRCVVGRDTFALTTTAGSTTWSFAVVVTSFSVTTAAATLRCSDCGTFPVPACCRGLSDEA